MTLGWGIIGLGGAADGLVAPAITADPNSRLVAAVSRDQGRADAFAAKHGVELATIDFDAMLADKRVDVVAITSPNALHPEQAIAAARAGKHVYSDKPMAPTTADAEAVLKACADSGVRIGMNFQTRHHACFQEAKRVIDEGGIGDIVAIQVDASPGAVPFGGWRTDQKLAGLGAVNNIAVHIYDLLRFLVGGEVTEVSAMFDVGREDVLERMPMVLMRFSTGAMAFANGNQVTPMPLNDIVIHGTTGRIDGRGITRPLKDHGEMRIVTQSGETTASYASLDAYIRTVAAFSRALLDGRDPDPSGLDGLRSVQLTDAIRISAREGRLVKVAS
jgi:1,5-anhydro-D-fructose reductase (1,5-anhydro-D-mannitol-forming)